jgi:hypothetical protein
MRRLAEIGVGVAEDLLGLWGLALGGKVPDVCWVKSSISSAR